MTVKSKPWYKLIGSQGAVSVGVKGIHSLGGMVAFRIALGFLEAGFFPGVRHHSSEIFTRKLSKNRQPWHRWTTDANLLPGYASLVLLVQGKSPPRAVRRSVTNGS